MSRILDCQLLGEIELSEKGTNMILSSGYSPLVSRLLDLMTVSGVGKNVLSLRHPLLILRTLKHHCMKIIRIHNKLAHL